MKIILHTYLRNARTPLRNAQTLPFALAGGADIDGIAAGGASGTR